MIESNPVSTALQIAGGYCVPRRLHVVANLGVADVLDDTTRSTCVAARDQANSPFVVRLWLVLLGRGQHTRAVPSPDREQPRPGELDCAEA